MPYVPLYDLASATSLISSFSTLPLIHYTPAILAFQFLHHSQLISCCNLNTCCFLCLVVCFPKASPVASFLRLELKYLLLREASIATICEVPCLFIFIILTIGWNYFMYLFVGLFAWLLTVSLCWNRASVVTCYTEILILQPSRVLCRPYVSLATKCTQVFIPVYCI